MRTLLAVICIMASAATFAGRETTCGSCGVPSYVQERAMSIDAELRRLYNLLALIGGDTRSTAGAAISLRIKQLEAELAALMR